MTQPSLASQHALVEHDPLDWPSGWHRSALWYTHTALQCGLLRVALGLCDGGMLTLPYSLEASGIPDAHRTSAFGLSHSSAQMGRLHTLLEPERAAARSRPAAAVEGPTRRGAWPWKVLGILTRVTAAVGWLTTVR